MNKQTKNKDLFKGFYFITSEEVSINGSLADVELALSAGVKLVQYRNKRKDRKSFIEEAYSIRRLCYEHGALFIVNDSMSLACALDADGVHLGQEDDISGKAPHVLKEGKILGISTHNIEEAIEATNYGAHYIGLGHIFLTTTKEKTYPPLGLSVIREVRKKVFVPIVAIGGIEHSNALGVIKAGADMICAISSSLAKGTVKENVRLYMNLFAD